jgi:FMN reductase
LSTHITVVSGGLREPSSTRLLADRLTAAVHAELARASVEMTSTVIELRPLAHAITDAMLTGFAADPLAAAFDTLTRADGVIAVTPAFNVSYSGLFKSFFDVLPEESLNDMPVLMGATGGTERHSLVLEHALRPMLSYLHAFVSPTGVYAATDDFGSTRAGPLADRIRRAAADFARLVHSCGPRQRRDVLSENLTVMRGLLAN